VPSIKETRSRQARNSAAPPRRGSARAPWPSGRGRRRNAAREGGL